MTAIRNSFLNYLLQNTITFDIIAIESLFKFKNSAVYELNLLQTLSNQKVETTVP